MRLSVKTCTLALPYEEMLDFCVKQGVKAVEIGTGNWSGLPRLTSGPVGLVNWSNVA